jgi:hypothetical protein
MGTSTAVERTANADHILDGAAILDALSVNCGLGER